MLRELRKKKKLSMVEVAKRLGIARNTLADIERHRIYPKINVLIELAAIYKVSVSSLVKIYKMELEK